MGELDNAASGYPIIGALLALAMPIIALLALAFIILKLLEVIPFVLNWVNRPKLRSEYDERRKTAMRSCPSKLRGKDLIIDYDNSSLLKSNVGRVIGYSTIPCNSLAMPDDNKIAKLMPTNLRLLFYVPHEDAFLYSMSFGLLENLITDLIFTDTDTKDITNSSIVLRGNSIEPMIGGAYHLLVSNNTPVFNLDMSLKTKQINAMISEFTRTLKDMGETSLRMNPSHMASLEHEGGNTEVPVNSPIPPQQSQKQGGILP